MTGDGHIGGNKLLSEKGCIAQRKAKIKEKNHSYWDYKLTW